LRRLKNQASAARKFLAKGIADINCGIAKLFDTEVLNDDLAIGQDKANL
jgi:hypothetical protein